jgi:GNAT superfamily N-acetyltransferase
LDVTIRYAEPAERGLLEDLQREASLQSPGYREALLKHPDAICLPAEQIADRRVRVAWAAGERVGFAVVLRPHEGVAELDGLFVKPAFWGRAIGRRLIADVVRMAIAEGAGALDVTANPEALGFYLQCGFARTGSAPTRFGPALRMRRVTGREAGAF